jgi:hypothetical protein
VSPCHPIFVVLPMSSTLASAGLALLGYMTSKAGSVLVLFIMSSGNVPVPALVAWPINTKNGIGFLLNATPSYMWHM